MGGSLRTWVEISTSCIAANYDRVRSAVGASIEVMPVVKADAYNHGAVEVARTLVSTRDVKLLAVASAEEGVALRQAAIATRILLMADFLPFERDLIFEYDLTPVLHAVEHIRELSALGAKYGRVIPFHLKVDTGLTRLGTGTVGNDVTEALRDAPHAALEGIMTHLASAENFESAQTDEQTDRFVGLCSQLCQSVSSPPAYLHMAASSAIAYGRRNAWHTLVRPGLSLYGYVSEPVGEPKAHLFKVFPALTWKAAVIAVKDLPSGTLIGYGGRYRTERPTRTAVLAAGYADGYPHRLVNKGKVIIHGHLAPIVGAVSMDLLTVDVTDCPPVIPGDSAILLGRAEGVSMDAQDIARLAETIPYAILCGIGRRVKRVYVA
jgi:alanine racemase